MPRKQGRVINQAGRVVIESGSRIAVFDEDLIDFNARPVLNVAESTNTTSAATRGYVDAQLSQLTGFPVGSFTRPRAISDVDAPHPSSSRGPQGLQGPEGGPRGFQGEEGKRGHTGCKGDKGDHGCPGDKGDRGCEGERGKRGCDGVQGPCGRGSCGSQGCCGCQGCDGHDGNDGHQGTQGLQGERGKKGCKGDPGCNGDKGDRGCTGHQGKKGPQGEEGPDGGVGPQGEVGEIGPQGEGLPGVQGPTGHRGCRGEPGDDGCRGKRGFQGDTGFQGAQGEVGSQGPEGNQGPIGFQGDMGFQGQMGPMGTQGFQGQVGDMGFQGMQGPATPPDLIGDAPALIDTTLSVNLATDIANVPTVDLQWDITSITNRMLLTVTGDLVASQSAATAPLSEAFIEFPLPAGIFLDFTSARKGGTGTLIDLDTAAASRNSGVLTFIGVSGANMRLGFRMINDFNTSGPDLTFRVQCFLMLSPGA